MRLLLSISFFCIVALNVSAQKQDKNTRAILDVMAKQEAAWNAGNLRDFMDGYWQSDSLKFIGSNGLTYGWQQTLDNYKKSYPNKSAMGKLTFKILSVEKVSSKSAFVIGKWHLKRAEDEPNGHFTLLWKKIDGKWVIVADHSS